MLEAEATVGGAFEGFQGHSLQTVLLEFGNHVRLSCTGNDAIWVKCCTLEKKMLSLEDTAL